IFGAAPCSCCATSPLTAWQRPSWRCRDGRPGPPGAAPPRRTCSSLKRLAASASDIFGSVCICSREYMLRADGCRFMRPPAFAIRTSFSAALTFSIAAFSFSLDSALTFAIASTFTLIRAFNFCAWAFSRALALAMDSAARALAATRAAFTLSSSAGCLRLAAARPRAVPLAGGVTDFLARVALGLDAAASLAF
ncbi:hypothetical protein Vafri_2220, partial [Volvox africanus]